MKIYLAPTCYYNDQGIESNHNDPRIKMMKRLMYLTNVSLMNILWWIFNGDVWGKHMVAKTGEFFGKFSNHPRPLYIPQWGPPFILEAVSLPRVISRGNTWGGERLRRHWQKSGISREHPQQAAYEWVTIWGKQTNTKFETFPKTGGGRGRRTEVNKGLAKYQTYTCSDDP